jgi:2-polyprenyl-3-methyl-5-hydroxy-6-metoxy-1,4-benzoquinol methylase
MLIRYSKPNNVQWDNTDIRSRLYQFDEDFFRNKYNSELAIIHKPLTKVGFNIFERSFLDLIVRVGGDILDIGCSNGRWVCSLLKYGYVTTGTGIDISDKLICNAKQTAINLGVNANFLNVAIENYQPSILFNIISAVECLEHIFALRDALAKIVSWLKLGGVFVGSVPLEHVNDCDQHLHYFSEDSLRELLLDYFDIVDISVLDVQGGWQLHLVFICRQPKRI